MSLNIEDFIPIKKYQEVLILPIGVQLKLICHPSKSRLKRSLDNVDPSFLESFAAEIATVQRGASAPFELIISDGAVISRSRRALVQVIVKARLESPSKL